MPAPLDVSIWHSIWTVEKDKTTLEKIEPKQAIFDFNVGYIGTLFLGVCFVLLGALVMYHSGETFSNKGAVFASQLIQLYTKNLGDFSYIASPRVMTRTTNLLFDKKTIFNYWFWIFFLGIGTFVILKYFMNNMGVMVKIATILSFLTAPFYAILNYVLITGEYTPKEHQPNIYLKILSIIGIVFLIGFSIWFLINL